MCGIVGIYGHGDVAPELLAGLTTMQHRGQDAAGLATLDGSFHLHKGLGLVSQIFTPVSLAPLRAPFGIGHVRYATQGRNELQDAQPLAVGRPFGLAMAHNGNVINFSALRRDFAADRRPLETSTDLELIVHTLTAELEQHAVGPSTDEVFDAVAETQRRVLGAYSTVSLLANRGCLAFTDPAGVRPLVFGRKETRQGPAYAFASETACFDCLGFEWLADLQAGEAVYVDAGRRVHRRICRQNGRAFCVFEYIYFGREDSRFHGRLVADERIRMGRQLGVAFEATGLRPDIVIDGPSSAYFFAAGFAEQIGVPYRRGLAHNPHAGRSFIASTPSERELIVRQKLNPIGEVVRGKRVAVVDDSVVRGTTARHIVRLLREAEAQAVYVVAASPPVCHPCVYGIDMSIQREMLAAGTAPEKIASLIGADAVVYQRLDDLRELYADLPCCFACFDGHYPIDGTVARLAEIERERTSAKAG